MGGVSRGFPGVRLLFSFLGGDDAQLLPSSALIPKEDGGDAEHAGEDKEAPRLQGWEIEDMDHQEEGGAQEEIAAEMEDHASEGIPGASQDSAGDEHDGVGHEVDPGQPEHGGGVGADLRVVQPGGGRGEEGDQGVCAGEEEENHASGIEDGHLEAGVRGAGGQGGVVLAQGLGDQGGDADLDSQEGVEGEAIPVEDDCGGGGYVIPVGVETGDDEDEAECAEEIFHPLGQSVSEEFSELLPIQEGVPGLLELGFPFSAEELEGQDGDHGEAGQEGSHGCAVQFQGGASPVSEDEDPVGDDIDGQGDGVCQEDDAGFADAGEEGSEGEAEEGEEGAEAHIPVVFGFQGDFRFRVEAEDIGLEEEPVRAEGEGVADEGEEEGLPHHAYAVGLLIGAVVLSDEGGGVSYHAHEKGGEHPAGDASAHGGRLVDHAHAGEVEAVHEHHEHVEHAGEEHGEGDGEQFQDSARALEMSFEEGVGHNCPLCWKGGCVHARGCEFCKIV